MPIQDDYLERVYAGVLGKLIGVYLGRPFEGWTYQRIMQELGPIHYYVHDRLGVPLVVTDDDVSGTFVFLRALEEHGTKPDLSAEEIGKTWLNSIIERRSILWWGGNGNSTEHTAWLNLKRGVRAPTSGAIETNGQTVAEQIGAQIFIDGWAMVAPGNPQLAAQLAEAAGSVSHDGEAVYAAKLLAAMEAEAFVSDDIDHLLDTGLSVVPGNSLIARLVRDVRGWVREDQDWEKTRQRIEDQYGYDKFPGNCHVVPNHAIIILALLYAGHDFHRAMTIVNTAGWDTDCNSGNIGCLIGIMQGLKAFEGGPDWRGPLADRAILSSADAGYSINNAARLALDVANLGRRLNGMPPMAPPKGGAQFHFTLPGSVQGFQAEADTLQPGLVHLEQGESEGRSGLAIRLKGLTAAAPVLVMTQTFSPPDVVAMRTYDLMASPLVYPGQIVEALVRTEANNTEAVLVRLVLKAYGLDDRLDEVMGPETEMKPGAEARLVWKLPELDGQPIQQVGLALAKSDGRVDGTVWLDTLRWSGAPDMVLKRPSVASDFWRRAWVNGVSFFSKNFPAAFRIAQDRGEGMISHGTRDWTDYRVSCRLTVHLGVLGGLAARVQGLNRYYALVFLADDRIAIIRVRDDVRTELASLSFGWELETAYDVSLEVEGRRIRGYVGAQAVLEAVDTTADALLTGGIAFIINEGALSTDEVAVKPVRVSFAQSGNEPEVASSRR